MSPLANLLSRGKEDEELGYETSDAPAPAPAVIAKVNLLPPEIAEAERFRRAQVGRGACVLVAVAVVGLGTVMASGGVKDAQATVDATTARSTQLSAEVAALHEVPETAAALKKAEAERAGALGQEIRWSEYLNNLGLMAPKSISLQNMSVIQTIDVAATGGAATPGPASYAGTPGVATVTYAGQAKTADDVAFFLNMLSRQKANTDASFSNVTNGTDATSGKDVATFGASVVVTDEAESGRYSTNGG